MNYLSLITLYSSGLLQYQTQSGLYFLTFLSHGYIPLRLAQKLQSFLTEMQL